MIYDSVAQLVGGTPLMKLDGIKKKYNLKSNELRYFSLLIRLKLCVSET